MLSGDLQNRIPVQRLEGKNVALEIVDLDRHLQPLWEVQTGYKVTTGSEDDLIFPYLMYGPFSTIDGFKDFFTKDVKTGGRQQYVLEYRGNQPASPLIVGTIGFKEVVLEHRTCEIANVWLDPRYRGRNIMDEAIYLMLKHAFEVAKYRRVQWTCNNRNESSKKMALRNQFKMEGVLRNSYITKGVNRDTALFSIIDAEWEEAKQNLETRIP